MGLAEEGGAFAGVVAEPVAEDAEEAGGVAEAAGDLSGGLLVDEIGAQGFVLALGGELRRKEEFLAGRYRYLFRSTVCISR